MRQLLTITDISIHTSPDALMSKEVMRLLKIMPKWKPGTINGKPKRVRFTLPVNFNLK